MGAVLMPRRHIDPSARETARALRAAGRDDASIAEALDVDRTTVTRWLGPARPQGRAKRPDVSDAEVIRLHAEGLSWRAIAARVGMSQKGVRTRFAMATGKGRPDRPRQEQDAAR